MFALVHTFDSLQELHVIFMESMNVDLESIVSISTSSGRELVVTYHVILVVDWLFNKIFNPLFLWALPTPQTYLTVGSALKPTRPISSGDESHRFHAKFHHHSENGI